MYPIEEDSDRNEAMHQWQAEQRLAQQECDDAVIFVNEAISLVGLHGFNDLEIPALNKILEDLKNKKISPKIARAQAEEIKQSKMDYH